MTVNYATLRDMGDLSAQSFTYGFGFDLAELHASTAKSSFDDVVGRITDGHAWTGEGRPNADAVLRLNAVALEVAETHMQAGTVAMQALGVALTTARDDAEDAIASIRAMAEGSDYWIKVGDDGRVGWLPRAGVDTSHPDNAILANKLSQEAEKVELQLSVIVGYAKGADSIAKTTLAVIANSPPTFSANASAAALAYNKTLLEVAKQNQAIAEYTYEFWSDNRPSDLQEIIDRDFSETDFVLSVLSLDSLKSFLKGRGEKVILDQFSKKGLSLIPLAYQAYTTFNAAHGAVVDPHLGDTATGPDDNIAKPDIHDPALADKLDEYFFGNGSLTLAQAAKLQANGQPDDDHDYVADAEDMYIWLNGWLEQHPPVYPESSGEPLTPEQLELLADREQALQLAHDLDAAIH